MICKGTTHNNGARLAAYMTTGKDGERAVLWQLRGFEATNIKDAFRDVQIMAGATKAQQPFFHVQVRNREGETLTRPQWEQAADRIERMLGLAGQPRAISFHTYERNGDEHMHIAWSRIDQNTLTAIPLPFFKQRLKKISRELELQFGLQPVTNRRPDRIKYAPTRAEEEQARRLGFGPHDVRNTIRDCYERSDCGASFQAALDHEGMILAKGEKRDFIVIDREGGVHALGKRILDDTASKIRARLSDLSRKELPSAAMAQAFIREQGRQGSKARQEARPEPAWDRDRDDRQWQDAVINAAIDKERADPKFAEPERRQERAGGRKKESTLRTPAPEPVQASAKRRFVAAGKELTRGGKSKVSGRAAATTLNATARTIGKTLDVASDAFASLFAPTPTPQQKFENESARQKREAEAEDVIDFTPYTAELARHREQEQEKRPRDRGRER